MRKDSRQTRAATFRVVAPGDEAPLLDLLADLDPTYFRPHPFTAEEVERITHRTGRDVYGMLMADDRPVAYGLLRGWDEGFDTPSLGVAVRVDAQAAGFGRLTMERLHAEARAGGATSVRLRVHPDNRRARGLYESFGYVETGEDRGERVMVLDLTSDGTSARGRAARQSTLGRFKLIAKRVVDLAGALIALVLLSPVLAWVALALLATQGRPILFRHPRPGLHGRTFTLVKFRTMREARTGEVWYLTDDARVTQLGRFLRSSSIDELPELWNVLRGEMSLVGPRPLLVEYLKTYTEDEGRRHDMRPGITSWAAVNGRHTLRFKERLQLDTWYVDHWSLRLDLEIMAMTIGQVLRRSHVTTTQDLAAVGFPLPGVTDRPSPDGSARDDA